MADENSIVVSGGVRYRKADADARGLKADSAAHSKKIAEGLVPVGTVEGGKRGAANTATAVVTPISTADANPAAADKK